MVVHVDMAKRDALWVGAGGQPERARVRDSVRAVQTRRGVAVAIAVAIAVSGIAVARIAIAISDLGGRPPARIGILITSTERQRRDD